jgi:rare lipoprotein A
MRSCIAAIGTAARLAIATVVVVLAQLATSTWAEAKTPGKTYCFRGYCHRVLTLAETQSRVGSQTTLSSSNYDSCKSDRFNPCGLTSSGAVFRPDRADNAASPIYPDGTIVLVRHPKTKKSAVLRINSAGPYHGKRLLDVSRATAEALGFRHNGVANLEVRILKAPSKKEATYSRNRTYASVPGYLGKFDSMTQASAAISGRSFG